MLVDAFVNRVVDEVIELYRPYVDQIDGLGMGNHELSFLKHYHTDLMQMVIDRLNKIRSQKLTPIAYLGVCGWVHLTLVYHNEYMGYKIFYHHGTSTNAPVTEGIIAAKRLVEGVVSDALVVGHVHKKWAVKNEKFVLNKQGNIECKPVALLCTGSHQLSYKNPGDRNLRWAEEKGFRASPMGGGFLKLIVRRKEGIEARIEI